MCFSQSFELWDPSNQDASNCVLDVVWKDSRIGEESGARGEREEQEQQPQRGNDDDLVRTKDIFSVEQ